MPSFLKHFWFKTDPRSPRTGSRLELEALEERLTPSSPAATTTQISAIHIAPNLFGGTAQLALTAQVNSAAGTVNEGNVAFTFAGHSAQGTVQNGTASAQLTVPLLQVIGNQSVSLAYSDNSSNAAFSPGSATDGVALNPLNALLPADVTFTPGGGEIDALQFGSAPLQFVYVNQQWTELRFATPQLQLDFFVSTGQVRVTLDGLSFEEPLSTLLSQLNGPSSNGSSTLSSTTVNAFVATL